MIFNPFFAITFQDFPKASMTVSGKLPSGNGKAPERFADLRLHPNAFARIQAKRLSFCPFQ